MADKQMVRPGAGVAGQKIKVTVNAYKVTLPSLVVHHYDVAVEGLVSKHGTVGDVPPSLGREIFAGLKAMNAFGDAQVVYDGRKTLFAPKLLQFPDNKQTFDVNLASPAERAAKRNRSFKVVLTKVNEVKLDNLLKYVKKQVGSTPDEGVYVAITALNVLCNHDMMMTHPTSKNKFFPRPPGNGPSDMLLHMKAGVEMWRGYFSSIRMAPGGLILNFDLTSQPMLKSGNLVDVACAVMGCHGQPPALKGLSPAKLVQLGRSLKMMKVSVSRVDKTILRTKIKDVAPSARAMFFEAPVSPDSSVMKKWNVAEYIEFTYNMRLRGGDLPVVKLTAKGWYPLEICTVEPGQKFSKKLSPEQLGEAIKWLTVRPQERTRMLTDGIRNHVKTAPTLGKWGVRMDAAPLIVPARRLAPPAINYVHPKSNKPEASRADNGAWNLAGKMFLKPMAVTSWVAVVLGRPNHHISPPQAARALEGLQSAMYAAGMQVSGLQAQTIFANQNDPMSPSDDTSVGKWIMSKIKSKPQLIVCFLRDKTAWEYRQIKLFGDSLQGIATQCLAVDKVVNKGNAQYFANVALKINVKLGGVNHGVGPSGRIFPTRTMVLGADVTHPGGDSLEPSIAAVVGSTNEFGSGYGAEFSVQPGRQEIISDLHHMVKELLIKFAQRNSNLPDKLIFYRDGVSEGQFPDVVAKEIPLVRQAMRAVGENAKYTAQAAAMKLTYVICGKRHHFKFGPTSDNKNESDRNGNLFPGVVIDTDIVHPFDFDWYGLSHAGLLGTSRASHYTVLVDDAKHKPDDLQTITYHLCYTYARATRSVSIATPAYYAHHVCTRIKQMLAGVDARQSSTSPTDIDLNTALREYQTKANEIRAAFRASYNKAGTFPVPEYWM
ncbi:hypothetical protein PGT21_002123 [Puccinia graminis f. sp. tritici]|uniref:Piwi domain-containing protein n=1 Tax=Puccinia graminis f. sp. tritici TaxID=56615 RepID=A0A5B0LK12_PUCGR|nr:hypothetical protein PGT21_002123 [Puccinia graminis f. sp. tritici]